MNAVVESAVGLACLVASVGMWRRGARTVGVLLAIAGVAAVAHAAISVL